MNRKKTLERDNSDAYIYRELKRNREKWKEKEWKENSMKTEKKWMLRDVKQK